jgi:hypothetical protein
MIKQGSPEVQLQKYHDMYAQMTAELSLSDAEKEAMRLTHEKQKESLE